ncbi:MAG: transglutaminase-like domain-containing protein [Candidatus Woesearchaeota archaeon]
MRVITNFATYFLVFFIVTSIVCAIDYDDRNVLEMEVTVSNEFSIIPTSNSYNIKFINASLSTYPKSDARQAVNDISTEPYADIGQSIDFIFNNPIQNTYEIRVDANVITRNMLEEVKMPVKFPLKDIDSSFYKYIMPTETIDITPEIRNLASELVGDRTDMYEIEYVFAEYVRKNIAYDLGTLTSDVNQKSSWVLNNKKGVCDELTNLFISLNRASGIPARFTSGIAYTNLDEVFGDSWVPHAWAEVYYPGVGWIPYDVTYGQYGFIDAGHVKLSDSEESSNANINYNYIGKDVRLNPGQIEMDVRVINYGENVRARYSFEAEAYADEVGFGSYDMITVNVVNDQSYYQVADLYLAQTDGIEIIEESKETVLNRTIHRKQVLLRPYQSETVYWIIRVNEDLDKIFMYTFPITVYNTYNDTSTTFVFSKDNYRSLDYEYFHSMVSSSVEESSKTYSKYVYLECSADKDNMYLEDSINIHCTLDNKGDESFDDVNICFDGECSLNELAVQKLDLSYSKNFTTDGLKNIEIKVYNDDFTKTSYIPINVMDKPKVLIKDLKYPESVEYGVPFEISFTLGMDSKSSARNLKASLKSEIGKVEWTFEEFGNDKIFNIKSNGDAMKPNRNDYEIFIYYEDDKEKSYTVAERFTIVSEATFLEKILLYLNLIGRSIEQAVTG